MLDETQIQESLDGHAARNTDLLDSLQRQGVRINDVHSVEHHFWADDQESAAALAKALYESGYLVLVIAPIDTEDGDKIWNVEAAFRRTLAEAAASSITEELVRLAARLGATYDGWGASVAKMRTSPTP